MRKINKKLIVSDFDGTLLNSSHTISEKVKKEAFFELIFMTYSYVHNAINTEAFPNRPNLYDKEQMTGRGKGKYMYKH